MLIKLTSSTHCQPSSSQHERNVSTTVNSSSIHSVDDDDAVDDDDGQLETDQVDIISTLCEIGTVTLSLV